MSEGWTVYGRPVRGRRCGGCTLCCTLVPVPTIDKPANTPCPKLCARGCSIYRNRPRDCRLYSCRWLFDETTAGLRRPDKTGYVIDPALGEILVDDQPYHCVQVWIDPARPDAHEDPALRAWLAGVAERYRLPALIRQGSGSATLLVAPSLTADGTWQSSDGQSVTDAEMSRMHAERGAKLTFLAEFDGC